MSFPSFPGPPGPGPMPPFPGLGPTQSFPLGPPGSFPPPGMMPGGPRPPGMPPGMMLGPGGMFRSFPPGGPSLLPPPASMAPTMPPPLTLLQQQMQRQAQNLPRLAPMQMQQQRVQSAGLAALPAPRSTTVWVGKIAPSMDDTALRLLLDACGPVKSWKRMEDTAAKELKNFGFCEYEDADGVLRAVRLLNNLKVDGFDLAVKSNIATQKYVDEFEAGKSRRKAEQAEKAQQRKEEGEVMEEPDTDTERDNKAMETIMALVSEREVKTHAAAAERDRLARHSSHNGGGHGDFDHDRPLPPPPSRHGSEREDMEASRERQLLADFQQGRDKERRDEESRRREADKAYEQKLREWDKEQGILAAAPPSAAAASAA